jgi:cell division protein ZipA
MSDTALLRIGILAAGLLLIAAIFLFGRPKKKRQGVAWRRTSDQRRRREAGAWANGLLADGRVEGQAGTGRQAELGLEVPPRPARWASAHPGFRQDRLAVRGRQGRAQLRGEDIVVAAEKTGLVFGHMNVFHRLVKATPSAARSSRWPAS